MRIPKYTTGILACAAIASFLLALGLLMRPSRQIQADVQGTAVKSIADIAVSEPSVIAGRIRDVCADGTISCVAVAVGKAAATYGPDAAFRAVQTLQSADPYALARRIGAVTAETFGANRDAYRACPADPDGACRQGFAAAALAAASAADIGKAVCGSDTADDSAYWCYRDIGRGLFTARAYAQEDALAECRTLPDAGDQNACTDGVFAEQASTAIRGEANSGFSLDDPLAPCRQLDAPLRTICFAHHAPWLLTVSKNNPARAGSLCLAAADADACLVNLGEVFASSAWQDRIAPGQDASVTQAAWALCAALPKQAIRPCISGATGSIFSTRRPMDADIVAFCTALSAQERLRCLGAAGLPI
jgi:hypothetical protein